MAMNPQTKDTLSRYTLVAKAIIYNTERMRQFIQMMGTPQGAIAAVHTVMQAIAEKRDIPPEIAPLLGVNVYMLMVDMAQQITGHEADGDIMKTVIASLLKSMQAMPNKIESTPPAAQPAPQGGLIQTGVAA